MFAFERLNDFYIKRGKLTMCGGGAGGIEINEYVEELLFVAEESSTELT